MLAYLRAFRPLLFPTGSLLFIFKRNVSMRNLRLPMRVLGLILVLLLVAFTLLVMQWRLVPSGLPVAQGETSWGILTDYNLSC